MTVGKSLQGLCDFRYIVLIEISAHFIGVMHLLFSIYGLFIFILSITSCNGGTGSTNEERLAQFRASACSDFYADQIPKNSGTTHNRDARLQPQIKAYEDRCDGGRAAAAWPVHVAQEMVVIYPLNIIYIEVRKASSTTLRSAFANIFHSHYENCNKPGYSVPRRGPGGCMYGKRCTTFCLNETHMPNYEDLINNFFTFTFVRDPVERFYSSWIQAMQMQRRPTNLGPVMRYEPMANQLRQMINFKGDPRDRCHFNEHIESQMLSLSSAVPQFKKWQKANPALAKSIGPDRHLQMPLDFIGRVEHLLDDFIEMLKRAEEKTGKQISKVQLNQLTAALSRHAENRIPRDPKLDKEIHDAVKNSRNATLDQLVRDAYAQDMVCLSYI